MSYIGGLYTGIQYKAGLVNNIAQINKLDEELQKAVSERKEDGIVSVFMMPYPFFSDGISPAFYRVEVPRSNTVGGRPFGYTPRNKKLLVSPYTFLSVDTGNGSNEYRFESSDHNTGISFILACGMSTNPEIVVYPYGYNGVVGHNPSESVACSGFPQCAFTIDSFRAWLAQSAGQQALGLVGQAGVTAAAFIAGGPVGAALPAIGLANSLYGMVKDATAASKIRGTVGSSTDVSIREKAVLFKYMGITEPTARQLDDYFDMYGYATNRIKIPNRNVRPYWCYCKTDKVALRGYVPADDMRKIESIYDNGITWWKDFNQVGNYSLNNSV